MQQQYEHYFEQQDGFVSQLIVGLFTMISETDTASSEFICKFCAIKSQYFIEKLDTLLAERLNS